MQLQQVLGFMNKHVASWFWVLKDYHVHPISHGFIPIQISKRRRARATRWSSFQCPSARARRRYDLPERWASNFVKLQRKAAIHPELAGRSQEGGDVGGFLYMVMVGGILRFLGKIFQEKGPAASTNRQSVCRLQSGSMLPLGVRGIFDNVVQQKQHMRNWSTLIKEKGTVSKKISWHWHTCKIPQETHLKPCPSNANHPGKPLSLALKTSSVSSSSFSTASSKLLTKTPMRRRWSPHSSGRSLPP